MAIVKMINEIYSYDSGERYDRYDGYEVVTDQCTYRVLISNYQSCCESWGFMVVNDDVDSFVGKALKEVRMTDTALNTRKIEEEVGDLDYGGIEFVDFVFDDGDILQIAVYNGHNGCYGHDIKLMMDDTVIHNGCL